MSLEDSPFLIARNWQLIANNSGPSKGPSNMIIHPNGRLYGELAQRGYHTWRCEGDRLIFEGRHAWDTWEFARNPQEQWVGSPVNLHRLATGTTHDASDLAAYDPAKCTLTPMPGLAVDKRRFEIVVAKLREDIAWTDCYASNITIYSKEPGDAGLYPVLPNLGRDAGTQLYHLVEHYDDLADRTLFLQGHPWDHPLTPIPEYARSTSPFTTSRPIENRIDFSPHWTKPDQKFDEKVMRAFLTLIECDVGISGFRWTQGMQIAISRAHVHRRPRDYYRRLLELSQRDEVQLAGRRFDNMHIVLLLELFWRDVFLARDIE